MGVPCLCRHSVNCDFENGFESIRSLDDQDLQSLDSIELLAGGSASLSARKAQDMRFDEICACHGPFLISDSLMGLDPSSPKHEAAIKLQKVYKSFRTRRKLADCAVLIEQSWWKLLDFAELKHSSISFFDLDKRETAISRWSRARTRAAKVGKGLSKNGKAQKLALQHWLEAIDPRHRYGHNLHFYYDKWLNSQSKEPFFYWLDIGEGKEVNLPDKCPRSKLQQQCIKYLGPMERKAYEVEVEGGQLLYKQTGEFVDTTKEPKGSKWIFVLSTSGILYVGKKKKGSFQHSSFLAGGATLAAGRIVAEKGVLKAVWPHSGHYRPTPENFQDLLSFLRGNNVDLSDVKLESTDEEEEESVGNKRGVYLRSNSFVDEFAENDLAKTEESDSSLSSDIINSSKGATSAAIQMPKSAGLILHSFSQKPAALEIPSDENLTEKAVTETQIAESTINGCTQGSSFGAKLDHSALTDSTPIDNAESKAETIPEESISQIINLDQGIESCQPGKQISCKWSSGAGARISCLRDYPTGLQCHALEQANLSPRSRHHLRLDVPHWEPTTTGSYLSCSSSCNTALRSSSVNRQLPFLSHIL